MEAAVENDGDNLKYVSDKLKADPKIVRIAVANDGFALKYAAEYLRSDSQFVKIAVANDGFALQYAAEHLRSNREIVKIAVAKFGCALEYAAEHLRSDREIVEIAVANDGLALEYAAEHLLSDRNICEKAVLSDGCAIEYCNADVVQDRQFVLLAVRRSGEALQYLGEQFRNDKEIVFSALWAPEPSREEASKILFHASSELRGDRDLIRSGLRRDCKTLLIASAQLQMDPDIVALACKSMSRDSAESFWRESFPSSSMRQLYVDRAKQLKTELLARNQHTLFNVADPRVTKQMAETWFSNGKEKGILILNLAQFKLPLDLLGVSESGEVGLILAYSGVKEDVVLSRKLLRFASILCHVKEGMYKRSVGNLIIASYLWRRFVTDALANDEGVGDDNSVRSIVD